MIDGWQEAMEVCNLHYAELEKGSPEAVTFSLRLGRWVRAPRFREGKVGQGGGNVPSRGNSLWKIPDAAEKVLKGLKNTVKSPANIYRISKSGTVSISAGFEWQNKLSKTARAIS